MVITVPAREVNRRDRFSSNVEIRVGRIGAGSVSTSFVERQNWPVRTTMRRYTRLSNGFSHKLENHAAATALNYLAYNLWLSGKPMSSGGRKERHDLR